MYTNPCCDHPHGPAINLSDDGSKYIDDLIDQLFKEKTMPDNNPDLLRAYGTKLGEAVVEGYGAKLDDFDWNSPDYETVKALQNNVWQFSAAKTHTQMRDMVKALVGPDGKVRSFDEFKIEAQQIANTQLNWLRAEYNTVTRGAKMAAKWVKIQAQKDVLPLLEFDAVIDDHSSNICPPLNRVTLPVDHIFWTIYYPPNHFNCRSTVRQLRKGKITPDKDIQYPENMQPLFKGNVGIDGGIFSDDHDYYTDVPPHIINNATLYMPPEDQYITKYESEDGTPVTVNRKTDIAQGTDEQDLLKVAKVLADQGKPVDILPVIHAAETELRATLLPGVAKGKNPDLTVSGEYTEVKTPTDPVTYEKLQQLIAKAVRQADRVIVLLDEVYDEVVLEKLAKERFKVFPDLKEIGFVITKNGDGEYVEFKNDQGQ